MQVVESLGRPSMALVWETLPLRQHQSSLVEKFDKILGDQAIGDEFTTEIHCGTRLREYIPQRCGQSLVLHM